MGKGSRRRPSAITREEEDLRWKLFYNKISITEFEEEYAKLKQAGKIKRNGRIIT